MQILGASFDTVEAQAAFAKKFGFTFPLLADTERKLGLAYGATDDPKAALRQEDQLPDRAGWEGQEGVSQGERGRAPRRAAEGSLGRFAHGRRLA